MKQRKCWKKFQLINNFTRLRLRRKKRKEVEVKVEGEK
jgi:hypothetical protein